MKNSSYILAAALGFALLNCDKTAEVYDHNEFEVIEHACLHMRDGGTVLAADTVMPGPHLDEEDYEHKRLKVVLAGPDGEKAGYIHFGPDITGDMVVMTDEDVTLAITNRTDDGDTELDIEETFTAAQIKEDADCSLIEKAILFEAKTGENIIKIGPTAFDTVSVIMEEGEHGH